MISQIIIFTIIGLIFGSFGSVLLTRLENPSRNNIKSVLIGRSRCPHCHHTLGRKQLMPLYSYLYQRGKCHFCKKSIASSYLWIELASSLIFLTTLLLLPNLAIGELLLVAITNWLLLLLIVFDIQKQLLHSSIWLLLLIPTLTLVMIYGLLAHSITASLVFLLPTLAIYIGARRRAQKKHDQKEGFGQGDIYLLRSLGLLTPVIISFHQMDVGIYHYILFYLYTLIIASILTLLFHYLSKSKNKQIAFIPGIILGFWIISILRPALIQ